MNDVAIIGAGAFGTALALQAARAGCRVTLWARNAERAAEMSYTRLNTLHLPGITMDPSIRITADMAQIAAPLTVLAVPTQHTRNIAAQLPQTCTDLVTVAKGVEAGSFALPLEVLAVVRPTARLGVLSGPTFAHELATGLPSAAVVAAHNAALRERCIAAFATPSFRLYGNDDPTGTQIGGATKNVIAIAAGVAIGAKLGENARAALVTRGLAEIARLTVALGGRAETVAGLSGLGDLMLTCAGASSRNFSCGVALGQGLKIADILAARTSVTEGVTTAPALLARAASAGVDMPIVAAVAAVVQEKMSVRDVIAALLSRPKRDE